MRVAVTAWPSPRGPCLPRGWNREPQAPSLTQRHSGVRLSPRSARLAQPSWLQLLAHTGCGAAGCWAPTGRPKHGRLWLSVFSAVTQFPRTGVPGRLADRDPGALAVGSRWGGSAHLCRSDRCQGGRSPDEATLGRLKGSQVDGGLRPSAARGRVDPRNGCRGWDSVRVGWVVGPGLTHMSLQGVGL